ncbi:hypothetical protein LEP1GSC168_1525 [Leptospira santarosai str. HAI134]|uniref:Uncharacterized protein n=1 Tax=Leptospira santarosai serovar Shermani str. LT 821 TaxID=758847 RepID=A0A097ESV9_9LEPT|nr:hypothetical protein LSS_22670 [Leptospira santarosai serovar Shermani str. LT 821]EMO21607.1 hypothetical protein LEP1GSC168_1525 [Leptospira santarosai str. HAI134]EMO32354.1 hypothetical protein LEP1GSC175_0539 [Leptospira santarosai str. HAI821]
MFQVLSYRAIRRRRLKSLLRQVLKMTKEIIKLLQSSDQK